MIRNEGAEGPNAVWAERLKVQCTNIITISSTCSLKTINELPSTNEASEETFFLKAFFNQSSKEDTIRSIINM